MKGVEISVVGVGLDGKLGLSESALLVVDRATVMVGAKRHLSYFEEHPASKILLQDLQQDLELVMEKAIAHEKVAILTSGDPLFFGLGRLLLSKIPAESLSFYPHVSSVQLAFSKLKLPWQDARLVSVHGRDDSELLRCWQQGASKVAVLTDSKHNPVAIAKLYLSLGIATAYRFCICENLTFDDATVTVFEPKEVAALASLPEDRFSTLNVLIMVKQDIAKLDLSSLPILGIDDKDFVSFRDRPGLMTKKEIRTLILAQLALQPQQVIWDLGAGTGSVSIEIARLVPSVKIYSVEKTAMGISAIKANIQRFEVSNVEAIAGKAPQALADLPDPDRIFIGGSGGELGSILNICRKRIAEGGVVVLALATIEHLTEVLAWTKENHWQHSLLQVQIARSSAVADLTRFAPLNPVTIVQLQELKKASAKE